MLPEPELALFHVSVTVPASWELLYPQPLERPLNIYLRGWGERRADLVGVEAIHQLRAQGQTRAQALGEGTV